MHQANMRLSPLALGITVGLLFGGAIFLVNLVAMAAPGYGDALLSGRELVLGDGLERGVVASGVGAFSHGRLPPALRCPAPCS